MKFKQPESYVPTLALVGGTLAGAMASRVGYNMLTKNSPEKLYKGTISLLAGIGAVFIDGNDAMSNLVRGFFVGASAEQGLSLVKGIVQETKIENTMIKQAVGLACPCKKQHLGTPRLQRGRIIPFIHKDTGSTLPFNPYSIHSNPNEEIDRALGLEEARRRNEEARRREEEERKALSTATTI